jgi:hypothetical protein
MKFYLPLSLILSSLLFGTCSAEPGGNVASTNSNANANANASKKANDNLEELGMLIKLIDEPEDVLWRDEPIADGRKLTAVILYLPASTDKIIADAEKHGTPADVSIEPADWYPKELISQSELSGGPLQAKQYPANDFFQAPYSAGRLIRIEGTDYIIVELSTK